MARARPASRAITLGVSEVPRFAGRASGAGSQLFAHHFCRHFLDRPFLQQAELEGSESDADQPADRPAEMLADPSDSVLSSARLMVISNFRLLAIERGVDGAVARPSISMPLAKQAAASDRPP
jgi:hypothetical protein